MTASVKDKADCTASVSVVIPAFNNELTIARAIDSALDQTLKPMEIIVVDDCSSDRTRAIVRGIIESQRDMDIHLVALDENRGPGNARNVAWDLAKGQYIAFLDADDTWHFQKLEIQLAALAADPEVYLIGGPASENPARRKRVDIARVKVKPITKLALFLSYQVMTPSVIVRRALPLRFSTESMRAEDRLLWLRTVLGGYKALRMDIALVFLHKPPFGHSGLSGQLWEFEKANQQNYDILLGDKLITRFEWCWLRFYSFLKYLRRLAVSNKQ